MSKFKIAAFIHDATFSANLAYTCNSLGYGLSFPELEDYVMSDNCVVIDLNDETLNPFVLGKTFHKKNIPFLYN